MEEYCVLVDVLEEVFACGFFVFVELDLAVFVVEVEKGVERVVVGVCLRCHIVFLSSIRIFFLVLQVWSGILTVLKLFFLV